MTASTLQKWHIMIIAYDTNLSANLFTKTCLPGYKNATKILSSHDYWGVISDRHLYFDLTNSALGRSPRYKYNVPVNILTIVTFSSFFTLFSLAAFFLSGSSGSSATSPEERVPIREEFALAFFTLVVFFFDVDDVLDSWEKVTVFCALLALSLPLLRSDSSILRFPLEWSSLGGDSLLLLEDGDDPRVAESVFFNFGARLVMASWALMIFPSAPSGISSFLRRRSDGLTIQMGLAPVPVVDFLTSLPVTVLPLYRYYERAIGGGDEWYSWGENTSLRKLDRVAFPSDRVSGSEKHIHNMYFIQYAVCSFHEWLPQTLWWQLQPVRPTWRHNACKCHNARKGSRHRTTLTNLNVIALFVGAVAASSSSTGRHGDLIEAVNNSFDDRWYYFTDLL